MFLSRFFKPQVERRIEVVQRPSSNLTVSEWRGNAGCLTAARKVLGNADCRSMLDTIRNEAVKSLDMQPDASLEDRALRQAEAWGIFSTIRLFESLAIPVPTQEMPEPEWAPAETSPTD